MFIAQQRALYAAFWKYKEIIDIVLWQDAALGLKKKKYLKLESGFFSVMTMNQGYKTENLEGKCHYSGP